MKLWTYILINRVLPLLSIIIFILVVAGALKWVLESVDIPTANTHCIGETVEK